MQAEPAVGVAGVTRDREAAASPADYVYLWKIDLQSAYRYWHNHPSELWMFGKQWGGESYLDCRTQFGPASSCLRNKRPDLSGRPPTEMQRGTGAF